MAAKSPEQRLAKNSEFRQASKLKNLLFEGDSALSFTPLNILFFALGVIFGVFALHLLIKIFPVTSSSNLLVGILTLLASTMLTSYLNRR
ncbi:hypothetical protein PAPHI01_1976 [Pancytospora philotis]|nr:hypothetical protein PAPHI01_1976 [Pancytospora philotis]